MSCAIAPLAVLVLAGCGAPAAGSRASGAPSSVSVRSCTPAMHHVALSRADAGCRPSGIVGQRPPARRTSLGGALSVALPGGWRRARAPITRLGYPKERLVVATYRLPRGGRRNSCGPVTAVAAIPPGGALVFLFEYDHAGPALLRRFERRPSHFALPPGAQRPFECFGSGRMIAFREGGRALQAMVALGPRAGARRRREVVRLLDSLRIEPREP